MPDKFWKIEKNRGSNKNPKWVWVASSLLQHDAEQLMFRTFFCENTRVVSSDGHTTVSVPTGPYDASEF